MQAAESLDAESVLQALALADLHQCALLRRECLALMAHRGGGGSVSVSPFVTRSKAYLKLGAKERVQLADRVAAAALASERKGAGGAGADKDAAESAAAAARSGRPALLAALSEDMQRLFAGGVGPGTDLVFVVGSKEIAAHQFVLQARGFKLGGASASARFGGGAPGGPSPMDLGDDTKAEKKRGGAGAGAAGASASESKAMSLDESDAGTSCASSMHWFMLGVLLGLQRRASR